MVLSKWKIMSSRIFEQTNFEQMIMTQNNKSLKDSHGIWDFVQKEWNPHPPFGFSTMTRNLIGKLTNILLLQWKLLNVITDNVINWLLWSNLPRFTHLKSHFLPYVDLICLILSFAKSYQILSVLKLRGFQCSLKFSYQAKLLRPLTKTAVWGCLLCSRCQT